MNKNELVSHIAEKASINRAQATRALEAVFDGVSGALGKGQEVRLVGFGTFSVAHRKAKQGRNPKTGAPIQIPASKQPKFKAGKALKDAVS